MPITWDQSLATGSAEIDRQHRSLFAQVAALADAMKQGKGRHEIAAMLDFLGKYVVQHFAEEEKLMDEVACPAAAANKQAHARLLSKYGDLRKRFDSAGGGPSLVLEMHEVLSKWLVDHIRGVDVQLRGRVGSSKQDLVGAAKRS
jgi:hemerythrin